MGHTIEDGTGQGFLAKVNSDNKLEVQTVSIDLHQISQETGRAYSIYLKRDIATANTEEPVGVIEYDGAGRAVLSQLFFSMSFTDIAETQGGRIEVHVIDGQTIANGTARTPIPINRGNQIASECICTSGEGTVISGFTIDATTEIFHCQLMTSGNTNALWDPQTAYLLEKGDKILITAKGFTSGVSLPGFRCTVRLYEEELDTI